MSLTDGSVDSPSLGRDSVTGRYLPGHRAEYHSRQIRLTDALKALNAAYKADTDADRILLALAAVHLDAAATARSSVKRTRESGAAQRILARIPRRPERVPTLAEVLEGGR